MSVRGANALGKGQYRLCHLMVALVLFCFSPVLSAAELECTNIKITNRPSPEIINGLQQHLIELGYYTGRKDSLWGPLTREALRGFCERGKFAWNDDLQVMVRNYAAIHQKYPDWITTLKSKSFQQWMENQADQKDIERVRQSGDSSSVIALLERFDARMKASSKKPPVVEKYEEEPVEAQETLGAGQDFVSYELTKDDLTQLKLKEKISELVLQLASKPYANHDVFEAEARKALQDVPDADEIIAVLERYGVREVNYRFTKESLEALKAKKVPDYILKAIEELKDLNYPARDFNQTVAAQLSAMTTKLMALRPEIAKFAEISPAGAKINEDSLKRIAEAYPDDSLVAAIIERLASRQGITYKSDKALAWAVKLTLTTMGKQIEDTAPLIYAEAVRVPEFVIDKIGAKKVADKAKESMIPDIYLALISELIGVDYPAKKLFQNAVKSRVEFATPDDFIMKFTSNLISRMNARRVDDELLAEWKKVSLPPAILEELIELQGIEFDSSQDLEEEIAERLLQLADKTEGYEQFLPRIVAQARKRHAVKSYVPIQWKGDADGCVLDSLAGETYGMYSYWMAGEQHLIDFSVHRRVGYFGVFLDATGDITESRHWGQEEEFQSFVRVAHTYCSKADLVVYRDTWSEWELLGPSTRQMFFKRAAENIARLVAQPLTDPFSKVTSYLSLGSGPAPVMGDGVTLYFPGYPQDRETIAEFVDFIHLLHDKLLAQGRKYSLNLMFQSTDMGDGVYDYSRLLKLKRDIEREDQIDSLFLVLLHEPTTEDKKKLRWNIEDNLHGEDRKELLHNVAMVISFDGKNIKQLEDDVIYANDNFGGIGFWTQPIMPEAATISKALREYYLTDKTGVTMGLCKIICPDRKVFRIAWGAFGLFLLFSFILYMRACEWRVVFKKYFIYFIVCTVIPFLLLTSALLSCDPAWAVIAKGNTLLLATIVGILAYSIWKYRDVKKRANLP